MKSALFLLLACVLAVAAGAWWWLGSGAERLDPPEVLQERVLQGPSVEVRSQAARDMVRHGPEAQPFVHRALAEYRGNDADVLVPLLQGAQKQRDWQSIDRLFELVEHPDARVRGKAGVAVAEIMGADYGFSADDPPEKRREVLDRMRAIHQNMKSDVERFYRGRKQ
jgi:hypothetical protein